jgi:hypothetical protein
MNNFKMWQTVDPLPTEIQAAYTAFKGLDVVDILPRLIMVRRAVAASFYTDDMRGLAQGHMSYDWLLQAPDAA